MVIEIRFNIEYRISSVEYRETKIKDIADFSLIELIIN